MRILLVKLRAIGDTVLTLPSLQALRSGFPGAKISFLVPHHSLSLIKDDPRVDEAMAYPRERLNGLGDHAGFYQELQSRHFDMAVCLHASFRTALIGWMSGAPRRSIRNHSGPDWFCNVPACEPKEPKSIIQRDFDAIRALGLDPEDERPRLFLGAAAKREAAAIAKKLKLPKGRTVLIFPLAGKPEKEWGRERFEALAKALTKSGRKAALVVDPKAEGWAGAIRVPGLPALGALCAHAGWAVGNDSGPRHIAAASGARTLTLFGPEQLREWHPYRESDGHWALRPESGRIGDLSVGAVATKVKAWLKSA